jgi:hypothetical protein
MKTYNLHTLWLLALLVTALPAQGQFIYSANNGTITITGYTGTDLDVVIPSTFHGLPVTVIGTYAFNNSQITNVSIPNSVTNIGDSAFNYCTSLTSVNIPNGITTIGEGTFGACFSLTNVNIPNSVTNIGSTAFSACHNLPNVSIPASVTSIGYSAFDACTSLTSLNIPNSVITIGIGAFRGCTSLTSVTIGSSLTGFEANDQGSETFRGCTDLNAVFFLGNAPYGDRVFGGYYPTGVTVYYLPGTTGWTTNFDGAPTALWTLPYPLVLNGSVGVQTNGFSFTVSWATNASVVVEASTDLKNPSWLPVQTNALSNGVVNFTDPRWTNYSSRFYRIRSLR